MFNQIVDFIGDGIKVIVFGITFLKRKPEALLCLYLEDLTIDWTVNFVI